MEADEIRVNEAYDVWIGSRFVPCLVLQKEITGTFYVQDLETGGHLRSISPGRFQPIADAPEEEEGEED